MRHSMRFVAVALFAAWSVSSAQNARLNAMGGVDIVKDPSNLTRVGAFMNDYPDLVQATASGSSGMGYSFGVKSLGDVLNIGFLSIPGGVLQSSFYDDARGQLNTINEAPAIGTFYPIPHLLLGLDLGGLRLGFDVFFELAHAAYKAEISNPPITEKASKLAFHPGVIGSMIIGSDAFYIAPILGLGLPLIRGEYDNGDPADFEKVKSENGFYAKAGVEIGMEAGVQWVFGGSYSLERYQFSRIDGSPGVETLSRRNWGNFVNLYAGFSKDILEDVLLAAQYSLLISNTGDKTGNAAAPVIEGRNLYHLIHQIRAGLEKPIEGFWVFESLIPRAGLRMTIADTVRTERTESGSDDGSIVRTYPAFRSTVNPTVGVGMSRGRFQLDANVSLGGWAGLIAGPAVLEATMTIDFGASPAQSRTSSVQRSTSSQTTPYNQSRIGNADSSSAPFRYSDE